ncbi:ABC transporter ATP-binding protein [Mesorhizobium sp. B2-4-15]|uniref:metal ABC transporter ATP-binding protein n=1 Tax=Mesorhizobium sp. B2-4-15 TaxID=2589934 RepID=UPI001154A624|nr:ABC transporter ATP-binding protein [Mesorhizobium sp. B2-4-15]TPK73588.1 ABC transporter ATP-binding protein [Mesorhizobium sp. B2-4-15]
MNVIAFDRVTLTYGGRRVLSDVSFSIPQGAFVGLLGANGAGKTTMLRAVLGLIRPASGAISVLGRPPTRGNPAIGYMPQARRIVTHAGISGFDLVVTAAGGHRWRWPAASALEKDMAWKALEEVGAADIARRPFAELSGGERQRILIAQSLIGDPKLLLLDEPLISLDAAHQRAIIELVHEVGERLGIAVIFCSHEINPLLRAVDAVLYLGNASAAIGSVDEVINGPVLSKLYGTHINVVRVAGRIFVMADDIELEGAAHVHDV